MTDKLKAAMHKIEMHVDTAVSEFTTPHVSDSLFDDMHKRCQQSLIDYEDALKVISSLHTRKSLKDLDKERLLTMAFFLQKMRDDTKSRICDSLKLKNNTLALASFGILRHNWAEVKAAYHEFIELTEHVEKKRLK